MGLIGQIRTLDFVLSMKPFEEFDEGGGMI